MSSTQPHAATSQDPALDISHQYPHEHAAAQAVDGTPYARADMSDDNAIPPHSSHSHSKDIESGVLAQEKGSSGDISRIGSGTSVGGRGAGGGMYMKYRVFVHAFIFCLFTG